MRKYAKKSTVAYYAPILLPSLVVVGALLFFVALTQSSLIRTYATSIQSEATPPSPWKAKYTGIMLVGPLERCARTQKKQCYKFFPGTGENFWVAADELPMGKKEFESNYLGKRVDVKGKGSTITINNKVVNYLALKNVALSPLDYTVGYGYGGGWVGAGYETYQDELGISSQSPGIYWSAVQLSAIDNNYTDRIGRYLDADMQHCQKKGFSCGIFIGGIPGWAVADARKKMNISCENAEEKEYALPLDTKQHENFAKFVAELGERYDGDCTGDGPAAPGMTCGPKAAFIMPFNETDLNQLYGCGGVPVYATNKDLNGNMKADYEDYADLMETVHNKLKSSNVDVPLATSRYAFIHGTSLEFIENVMRYQMATYGKVAYDVFDIHYYENDQSRWVNYDKYSNGSIRGKLEYAKNLMAKYGGIKPIVITETGMYADRAGDIEQAKATARIFAQAFTKEVVQSLQFFTLIGRGNDKYYGLVIDNDKRPSYNTFKIMQSNMRGYRYLTMDRSDLGYIEGYVYINSANNRKIVLWKNKRDLKAPDKSVVRSFNYPRIFVTDTIQGSGTPVPIDDGSPADKDLTKGKVGIELTANPVIVNFETIDGVNDELMAD